MSQTTARLLIVDDDATQLRALCDTLEFQGYATSGYASARRALAALEDSEFDVVLTDLKMPEMDGIELLAAAQKCDPNLVGVVMTGHATVDTAVDAMKAGSIDYVLKPFKLGAIMAVLTRALAVRRLRAENLELKETLSIHSLSSSLASVLDSRLVPERLADAAMQLPQAAGACVLLHVPQSEELRVAALRGDSGRFGGTSCLRLDAPIADWIARSREEIGKTEGQITALAIEHPLPALEGAMAVPMLSGGALMGILAFFSKQPQRPMRIGHFKALTILAGTAATALEAALLLEEMEQRVAMRTKELEAANEELDAFSHSVSHDLRAPLRAIQAYCEIVVEEHASNLPAEARRLLGNVQSGAQRMAALINDLLAFSRFTRQPMATSTVDVRRLAEEVLQELTASASYSGLETRIAELPECRGDAGLLKQVLTNLLSNALKFSRHRPQPQVEVGFLQDPHELIYFVRDNGAGFDMKYADRLFGVFQRLHSPSQFEGTGVGLSIVRRIIARHGGRVWAESCPDAGATFYFSLPKLAEDK